jgi:hypothetical protein
VDYEALLKKYMQHVRDCESIDYVDHIGDFCSDVEFTQEEREELERISEDQRA